MSKPYRLAAKRTDEHETALTLSSTEISKDHFTVIAGPCSVESRSQMMECAHALSEEGITLMRGGAFKPRTSPYSFQGNGEKGLMWMKEAADAYGINTVSEVVDREQIPLVSAYVDMLQVGARNMHNYSLLTALGETSTPVFLKRGMSATYEDLLLSAEYILERGNPNVLLCERGIRTFESYARNTLDIAAVPILQSKTHLPIFVDPSHGVGLREMVPPLVYAALAAGADGVMIEVHPRPEESVSDSRQTIGFETLSLVMERLRILAPTFGRKITTAALV